MILGNKELTTENTQSVRFRLQVATLKCASDDIEALIELWLNAIHNFTVFYREIPEECLNKPFDKDGSTALAVGEHVMGSALLDMVWCLRTAGALVPECEIVVCEAIESGRRPLRTRPEIVQEANRLMDVVPRSWAPLTSEQIYRRGAASNSPELIIEHAIVHFYRHRRQLEVRLISQFSINGNSAT